MLQKSEHLTPEAHKGCKEHYCNHYWNNDFNSGWNNYFNCGCNKALPIDKACIPDCFCDVDDFALICNMYVQRIRHTINMYYFLIFIIENNTSRAPFGEIQTLFKIIKLRIVQMYSFEDRCFKLSINPSANWKKLRSGGNCWCGGGSPLGHLMQYDVLYLCTYIILE